MRLKSNVKVRKRTCSSSTHCLPLCGRAQRRVALVFPLISKRLHAVFYLIVHRLAFRVDWRSDGWELSTVRSLDETEWKRVVFAIPVFFELVCQQTAARRKIPLFASTTHLRPLAVEALFVNGAPAGAGLVFRRFAVSPRSTLVRHGSSSAIGLLSRALPCTCSFVLGMAVHRPLLPPFCFAVLLLVEFLRLFVFFCLFLWRIHIQALLHGLPSFFRAHICSSEDSMCGEVISAKVTADCENIHHLRPPSDTPILSSFCKPGAQRKTVARYCGKSATGLLDSQATLSRGSSRK